MSLQSAQLVSSVRFKAKFWEKIQHFISDGRMTTVILFLPASLVLFTLFVTLPLFEAAQYSGYKWSGYGQPTDWAGFRNFEILLKQSTFKTAFFNSIKVIVVSLFVQIPLAVFLAMLIHEKTWSNTVFRLIFFLPFIMAEITTGLIWSFVFDGDYGISSTLSNVAGVDPIYPLSDRFWAMPVILFVIVWKYFGFHMMIFIAALQSIPKELIEAARVDGGTPYQIAWYVKLPLLKPAIAISIFFSVLGSLQLFDLIIPLTNGGPSHSTHTIVSYLYTFGLVRLNVGFGSAVGVVLFVICLCFAVLYRNTVLKEEK